MFQAPAPCDEAIALGRHRQDLLVARLLAIGDPTTTMADESWLAELPLDEPDRLQGLAVGTVPEAWLPACLRAGIPLTPSIDGLQWGTEVIVGDGDRPGWHEAVLDLPATPEQLLSANGVELKPLRRWVAHHWGPRLQAAPGLGFFLWPERAILVSTHGIKLAGFMHGPKRGQRHVLAFPPGGSLALQFHL